MTESVGTGERPGYAAFPKDRIVEVSDGTPIAFVVCGNGPNLPVIYVNGWTCSDSYWAKVAPRVIDAGSPCVFFDLRGHGQSGLPRDPGVAARQLRAEDVCAQRLALDVVEVLDAAGFDRAVVVGHSIGVQIAVEVCRIASPRVAGLVAVAGAFEDPVKTLPALNWLYPMLEPMLPVLPLELLRPVLRRLATPARGRWAAGVVGAVGPKTTADDMAMHMQQIGATNFSVLLKMLSALRTHDTASFLPHVGAPTLVLAGHHDRFTPPAVMSQMANAIPGAEIIWFKHAGHLLPVEEAEGVTTALTNFLATRADQYARATKRRRPVTPGE